MTDREVFLAILASFTQIVILLINTKYTFAASQSADRNGRRLSKLEKDVQESISHPFLTQKEQQALKDEADREQRSRLDI